MREEIVSVVSQGTHRPARPETLKQVAEKKNLTQNVVEVGNGKRPNVHIGVGQAYETAEEIGHGSVDDERVCNVAQLRQLEEDDQNARTDEYDDAGRNEDDETKPIQFKRHGRRVTLTSGPVETC